MERGERVSSAKNDVGSRIDRNSKDQGAKGSPVRRKKGSPLSCCRVVYRSDDDEDERNPSKENDEGKIGSQVGRVEKRKQSRKRARFARRGRRSQGT